MTSSELRNARFFDSVEAAIKIKNKACAEAWDMYERSLSTASREERWDAIGIARTRFDISVEAAYAEAMEVAP